MSALIAIEPIALFQADGTGSRTSQESFPRGLRKPKYARFSTAVEPSTAKAGDAVTLKVTVKLDPGWHIFQHAKSFDGEGPKPTLFDTFDLAGLVPKGDWTSSQPPIQKKDINFPTLEKVEFFEDEVTWSLPLEVPAGASPGSKVLRVQAGYQTCSNSLCLPPGQWTLPDATLTIESGGTGGEAPSTAPTGVAGPSDDRSRPRPRNWLATWHREDFEAERDSGPTPSRNRWPSIPPSSARSRRQHRRA